MKTISKGFNDPKPSTEQDVCLPHREKHGLRDVTATRFEHYFKKGCIFKKT